MYQERQQNTLYPKGGRYRENNLLKLLIGSQPIIEGRSLIFGRLGEYSISQISFSKSDTFEGKGYFAADGTSLKITKQTLVTNFGH